MSCNECQYRLPYLYKNKLITDDLFSTITAGHPNKPFYDLLSDMINKLNNDESTNLMYALTLCLPAKLRGSWVVDVTKK